MIENEFPRYFGEYGSGPTRLTNQLLDDRYPSWSPDGSQIAFISQRDGNQEIYLVNV